MFLDINWATKQTKTWQKQKWHSFETIKAYIMYVTFANIVRIDGTFDLGKAPLNIVRSFTAVIKPSHFGHNMFSLKNLWVD